MTLWENEGQVSQAHDWGTMHASPPRDEAKQTAHKLVETLPSPDRKIYIQIFFLIAVSIRFIEFFLLTKFQMSRSERSSIECSRRFS